MITKTGKSFLPKGKIRVSKAKWFILPATLGAAYNFPKNYDASMHYVDPMDNTYSRDPGIIHDTLKRNPYVHA